MTIQLNARAIEVGYRLVYIVVLSLVVPSTLLEIRMSPSLGFPRISITWVIKYSS